MHINVSLSPKWSRSPGESKLTSEDELVETWSPGPARARRYLSIHLRTGWLPSLNTIPMLNLVPERITKKWTDHLPVLSYTFAKKFDVFFFFTRTTSLGHVGELIDASVRKRRT